MAQTHLDTVMRHVRSLVASQNCKDLSDRELLRAFAARNDQGSFAALVKRHGPLVLSVCRRVLHQLQDAEDAFQATFIVLAKQAATLSQKDSLAGWLHGVSFRVALTARRAAARRRKHERQSKAMAPTSPAREAAWREIQCLLDEEIQHLPEKYREPFVLCCLDRLSCADAARQLRLKQGTVWSRLAQARKKLQERLARRGVTLTAALGAAALAADSSLAGVPEGLFAGTVEASLTVVASKTLSTGVVVDRVAFLVKAIMRAMVWKQVKLGVVLLLSLGAVAGITGLGAYQSTRGQPAAAENSAPGEQAAPGQQANGPKKNPVTNLDAFGDPLPEGAVARLGTRRFRHEGEATALVFTPNGKTLVGLTGTAVLRWDATTGWELPRLAIGKPGFPHDGFCGIAISPDGSTLAISESSGEEGLKSESKIAFWDLQSGKKTRTLSLPPNESRGAQFHTICFTPDGKHLAVSYTNQGKAVVFDLVSGQVQTYLGGRGTLTFYNLTTSPDSKTLAAAVINNAEGAARTGKVQIWNMVTGKLIRTLYDLPAMGGQSFVRSLTFSPDGKMLAFGTSDRIVLSDPATGKILRELKAKKMGQITGMAFTPDGKTLVTGGEGDGKIHVWDVASGRIVYALDGRVYIGRSMALSPDGTAVALGTCGNAVRLWDVRSGKEKFPEALGHDSQINDLAFSHDGKTLVSAGVYGKTLMWDMTTGQASGLVPASAQLLALAPDGKHVATVPEWEAKIRIWDTKTRKPTRELRIPEAYRVLAVAFSVDSCKLISLDWVRKDKGSGQHFVRQWDVVTGKQDRMWPVPLHPGHWTSLALNGQRVIAALEQDGFGILDVNSGRIRTLPGAAVQPVQHPLSFDGRVLASAVNMNAKAPIQLWEVMTGKEIWRLPGHEGSEYVLVWSPDGRLLASGDRRTRYESGAAQTIRLWDAASGKQLACFGGFDADVTALAFSPDGASLVAGLRDSTILIYDLRKFDPRRTPSARLDKAALERLWKDLGASDVGKAHQAIWTLTAGASDSMPFLKGKLKPTARVDAATTQKWIADLDSAKFPVRRDAARKLELCGGQIRATLEEALKGTLSLETRRRLQETLKALDMPGPETARTIRAIMVLERIGSADARSLLEVLAQGASAAHETEEARASLQRLAQRADQIRAEQLR